MSLFRGDEGVTAISCPSDGNCAAVGYEQGQHHLDAFIASEVHGTWGRAKRVHGLSALDLGDRAVLASVDCSAPGYCLAGGTYTDGSGMQQAFLVSDVKGTWSAAQQIPGLGALGSTSSAIGTASVSCSSPGNCSAGGYYQVGDQNEVFVIGEQHGTWGQAEEVPGLAELNTHGWAELNVLSCGSAGDCEAGGYYSPYSSDLYPQDAFVVSEQHGVWQQAIQVRGTVRTALQSSVTAMSCPSAGNCAGGGVFDGQVFVVSERHGRWGASAEVPGSARLNRGDDAQVVSVSCASAGNCSAGGYYSSRPNTGGAVLYQAFVVNQVRGAWGRAVEVPGSRILNKDGYANVSSISCAAPGDCTATGEYEDEARYGFVVREENGNWRKAYEVPAMSHRFSAGTAIGPVSCWSPGNCVAGGGFSDVAGPSAFFDFFVTEKNGAWGKPRLLRGF